MGGPRSNVVQTMQYLKGPGFEDFLVVLLAALAGGAYWSEQIHWIFAVILATPLVFGTIPKLRLITEMNRRMADRRKHLPKKESKFSAASKRIRAAGTGALRRVTGNLNLNLPPLMNAIPKPMRIMNRTNSPRGNYAPPPRSVSRTCSISEPSSPKSGAAEPHSPILSPEALSRRLNERLHFSGNKHEFFSRSKFAGCLREDECNELLKLFEWVNVDKGGQLFATGDSSEGGLYMLVEGRLGVYIRDESNNEEFLSYHMHPGDSIGDTHVLAREDTPRLCSLRAAEASVVMQLTRARFRSFCMRHPDGLLLFLRFVLGRLHRVSFFVLAEFLGLPHLKAAQPDCLRLPEQSDVPALFESALSSCVATLEQDVELYEEHPKHMFVLLSGAVRITARTDKRHAASLCTELRQPCIIGARAFWTVVDPTESARALAGSRVAKVDLEKLMELAAEAAEETVELVLATTDVLLPVIHSFISLGLSRHWLTAGEALFEEGEEADGLYLLITGRVRLSQARSERVTMEVGRGDMLGEEAVLEEGAEELVRRRVTATCVRDCEVVKLAPRNLELMCRAHPQAALKLVQSIARRQLAGQRGQVGAEQGERQAGHSKTANLAVIALLPLNGESESETVRATRRLGKALSKFGEVLTLDEERIGEILGSDTVAELDKYFYRNRVSSWIVQQEEDFRFILLRGDRHGSAWSQVCVSQADCVLLLALHDSLPAMLAGEQVTVWDAMAEGRLNARTELVLLHPSQGDAADLCPPSPRLTRLWMDQRPALTLHHHIRVAFSADLERLARHLAGRAIGLVLGGGGARGLAHLGVLKAMEELRIPVDFIGGTSQGAFMAALYAQKLRSERMEEGVTELSEGIGSLMGLMRDFTLPVLSMFSGKSFSHTIRQSLGALDIRDTWINFFCVSCSVSAADKSETVKVHRTGTLWKYVRASMTVVGYLPPVWDEGELLVDGGYVNNLPSDEMVNQGVHTIIGVDVEDHEDVFKNVIPLDDHVSGWTVLWFNLLELLGLSGGFRVPRHRDITTALCYIAHTQQFPRAKAMLDLKLSPPCGDIALLDYHKRSEIVERGYQHAMELLVPWVQKRDLAQQGELHNTVGSYSMPMMGPQIREGNVTWDQVTKQSNASFSLSEEAAAAAAREQQEPKRKGNKHLLSLTFKQTPRTRKTGRWEERTRKYISRGGSGSGSSDTPTALKVERAASEALTPSKPGEASGEEDEEEELALERAVSDGLPATEPCP